MLQLFTALAVKAYFFQCSFD